MRRIAAALVIRRKRRCHPVIRRNSIPVQIETMITEATGIEKQLSGISDSSKRLIV